jgi:two-component system, OmpR family, sensor histidine kinase QseC
VSVYQDGAHGVVAISDTGPGIPDDAKLDVFNRFRRLPDAKAPGTGLGLSIVQRIAELHGAEVALQDVEARSGLRVTIRIPMAA